MRTVKALDVKKFMNECCTRVMTNGTPLVTHKVDGRVMRSIPSKQSVKRDFFIIKYKNPTLIQRYIAVIREENSFGKGTNIMAYFSELKDAETYLEDK
jgi:hypothetical protein